MLPSKAPPLTRWPNTSSVERSSSALRTVSPWIDDEMENLTNDYVAYVQEHISLAEETCGDPQVLIEQRLDFSHICLLYTSPSPRD